MIKLVEICNLNDSDNDPLTFINVNQISSIKRINYCDRYEIVMSNNCMYETDRESIEKIMGVIGYDQN